MSFSQFFPSILIEHETVVVLELEVELVVAHGQPGLL